MSERKVKARAKEWQLNAKDGKESIAITFTFSPGHAEKYDSITAFLYFTEKTLNRTLDSLRHCGWQTDSLADLDTLNLNEVELVIDDEEFQGKWRTRVKWVNRIGGLDSKNAMDKNQQTAFAMRLQAAAKANKVKYEQALGNTLGTAPSHDPADDLGF